MVTADQIQRMARVIAEMFHPSQIILFGSYAAGHPTADSDVDLMVVVSHVGPAPELAARIRLALPTSIPIDVIVRSPEKLRERLALKDFFLTEVVAKGRVLYEAAHA